MTSRPIRHAVPAELATLVLALTTVILLVASLGCARDHRAPMPSAPALVIEVGGTLVAIKDDRSWDGGVDLTLETFQRARELVRVPSLFIGGPRDSIAAMHEVVNAAKLGDRLVARGTRDATGAVLAEVLELNPR